MSLRLIPPGKRKGNKFYVVRGSVDGRDFEVSTKTGHKATAEKFRKELERQIIARGPPRPGKAMTFAAAAQLYANFRGLDLGDQRIRDTKRILRLNSLIGKKLVGEVRRADLVAAADVLCPDLAPQTKNREVFRVAVSILHYAAENDYCPWRRVKLFKEPQPQTRAASFEVARKLIEAAPEGRKRLLLLWLFRHGSRITQTLGITWEDGISLKEQVFRIYDKKGNRWREFPIHPEVLEELTEIPADQRRGRLWPWRGRTSVYYWLRPLVREIQVKFTPHMARHSLGAWLNEVGAGLRTIMAALGHDDMKSSIRYQSAGIEVVRAANEKIRAFRGKKTP